MRSIAIKYGLYMFICLVILFTIVHLIGLSENYHLRVLNGFIHLVFLHMAIRQYRREYPDLVGNYLSGVAVGLYMTFIAAVLFAASMMIFLTTNVAFFEELRANFPYPDLFTPFRASLVIVVEGIATSVIAGYIVTRIIDSFLE